MSILEITGLRAGYGRLTVLFDVDLTVDAGEWISILGANGAGRSTLLKAIMGGATVTAGEIRLLEERITHQPPHRRVAAGISMSPEGRHVLPTLTVRENLIAGAYVLRSSELAEQFERVYEVLPVLEDRAAQRAGSLSGGEQQMLAIGRALMARPRVLLVDELSLGLAPIITEHLYSILAGLRDRGLALLVVDQEHAHASLRHFCDRQLLLEKGRFVSDNGWELDVAAMVGGGMDSEQL